MTPIPIRNRAGTFAENKDIARDIRLKEIIPSLEKGEGIVLDFQGVDAATQSFIHALISDVLRKYGTAALDTLTFKSCNDEIKKIITIVTDYMQEGLGIGTDSENGP